MGKFAAAIADENSALNANGKDADASYIRGLSKLKTGDAIGGNADIAAAKAINPKIAEAYAGYGMKP